MEDSVAENDVLRLLGLPRRGVGPAPDCPGRATPRLDQHRLVGVDALDSSAGPARDEERGAVAGAAPEIRDVRRRVDLDTGKEVTRRLRPLSFKLRVLLRVPSHLRVLTATFASIQNVLGPSEIYE